MQNHSCTSSSKRYVAKNLFFYKEHILKTAFLPSIQLFNTPSPCQAQAITTPCQPYIYRSQDQGQSAVSDTLQQDDVDQACTRAIGTPAVTHMVTHIGGQ